jgi:hypothetical protein
MSVLDFVPSGGAANAEGVLQSPPISFATWATVRGGAVIGLTNPTGEIYYQVGATPTSIFYIQRAFFKITYTGIPVGAVITGATFNYHYRTVIDTSNIRQRTVLCLGTQANTLTTGDWANISTEHGRDATSVWADNTWKQYSLNAAGLAAITPNATVKYCFTTVNDFDNSEPGNNEFCGVIYKGPNYTTDTALRPYIEVAYTTIKNLAALGVG